MCLIQFQNYIMNLQKHISMNTMNYQILKYKNWILKMIVKVYFLKHAIVTQGSKIKNRLIKKNQLIYHQFYP